MGGLFKRQVGYISAKCQQVKSLPFLCFNEYISIACHWEGNRNTIITAGNWREDWPVVKSVTVQACFSFSFLTQKICVCWTYLTGLLLRATEDVGLDTEDIADGTPGTANEFVSAKSVSFLSARSIASISAVSANSLISSITPSHSKKLPSR